MSLQIYKLFEYEENNYSDKLQYFRKGRKNNYIKKYLQQTKLQFNVTNEGKPTK